MKFECGDLEHALRTAELMPEAREHLKSCPNCRREFYLWGEISAHGRELHQTWDSPDLWPRIRQALAARKEPVRPVWKRWQVWSIAAAVLVAALLLPRFWIHSHSSADRDFLTDQTLAEVEKNEAAYRQSIAKLSRLTEAKLAQSPSAFVVSQREKILTLDSAIADTRSNIQQNRYNVHLQMTLAGLYREKQQTLEELLTRDQKN